MERHFALLPVFLAKLAPVTAHVAQDQGHGGRSAVFNVANGAGVANRQPSRNRDPIGFRLKGVSCVFPPKGEHAHAFAGHGRYK